MSHTYDTAHDLRALVRDLWLSLLPDGHSGTFADGGGDSLSALRLIGAVYGACGVRMTWDDLGTATDVDDFATRVLAAVPGEDGR